MIELLIIAGAVPFAVNLARRAQAQAAWKATLDEVARTVDGQVTAGGILEDLELRAALGEVPVTVRVRGLPKASRVIVTADAVLEADAPATRLYVGWGVHAPPAELAHIPDVPTDARQRFDRRVFVRADWGPLAEQFIGAQADALGRFLRATPARAHEVLYRRGRVHVAVHGMAPAASAVVALVAETARLRGALGGGGEREEIDAGRAAIDAHRLRAAALLIAPPRAATPDDDDDTAPSPPAAPPRPDLACHLCGEHSHAEPDAPWARCLRCERPYHARCWAVATGCVAEGCVETRSLPV